MADFSVYQNSMDERRKRMSQEERRTAALEQIADMMWGVHEELMEIRRRIPKDDFSGR